MSKTRETLRIFTQRTSQDIKSNYTLNHPMTAELFKFGVTVGKKPTDHNGLFGFTLHPVMCCYVEHNSTSQSPTTNDKAQRDNRKYIEINLLA